MALSLTAEQRELLKIFKIEEQYVIPAYQRPYSWGYDECFQLYNDLMEAYNNSEDSEEYFIGNIIIARSENDKTSLEVIDGQQRLTTLILLIKVMHSFAPNLVVLEKILEEEDWEGNNPKPRIVSEIFEAKDGDDLNLVLGYSPEEIAGRLELSKDRNGNYNEKKAENRFEANLLYFYDWIVYFLRNNGDINKFVSYLLKKVYMLPIELTGKTKDEASEKALVIFETINNRGMNLEDADIFKAKLYKKARKVGKEKSFIESWLDFKNNCEGLKIEVDDAFRYYSHVVRGNNRITSSEINLREFFVRENYSPFDLKDFEEVLADLFKIIEILEYINREKRKETEVAKWLQLIDLYTNQYPKFAVVVYFFINGINVNNDLILFLKNVVRYVYFQGSTSRVKFEVYNMIKAVCSFKSIETYYEDISIEHFTHLGRLKYGYALLAFYIERDQALKEYSIDKIINLSDEKSLSADWKSINLEEIIDSLGNFIVLDIPKKKIPFLKKKEYFLNSNTKAVSTVLDSGFSYLEFVNRDKSLKNKLVGFFKGDLQ